MDVAVPGDRKHNHPTRSTGTTPVRTQETESQEPGRYHAHQGKVIAKKTQTQQVL